eukprot:scaffold31838_cov61-Attheya_sp.AAC.1
MIISLTSPKPHDNWHFLLCLPLSAGCRDNKTRGNEYGIPVLTAGEFMVVSYPSDSKPSIYPTPWVFYPP